MLERLTRYPLEEVARLRIECLKCGTVVELSPHHDTILPPQLCPGCREFFWDGDLESSAIGSAFMNLRRALRVTKGSDVRARLSLEFPGPNT